MAVCNKIHNLKRWFSQILHYPFPLPLLRLRPSFHKWKELVLQTENRQQECKYFSQAYLLCNHLSINALQNLLFCVPKAAVLHGKSVGFTLQNSRFRNAKPKLAFFVGIIFTNPKRFPCRTTLMYAANIRTDCRGLIHHIPNTKEK